MYTPTIPDNQEAEWILFYDPSEKRDEDGKWTTGGSGVKNSQGAEPSESVKKAIRSYTAAGGGLAGANTASEKDFDALKEWLEAGTYNGPAYRGLGFSEKEWDKVYENWITPGSVISQSSMASWTKDSSRKGSYGSGPNKVYLEIEGPLKRARDVQGHSVYKEEQEVLQAGNSKLQVVSAENKNSDWYIKVRSV